MINFSQIPKNAGLSVFQSAGSEGWGNLAAWDPSDEISLGINDDFSRLIEFVDRNNGSFLTGYISFEAGLKEMGIEPRHISESVPAIHFRAYSTFKEYILPKSNMAAFYSEFIPTISREKFASDFKKIKNHIKSGDFYQVNYTHPLKSKTEGEPRALFQKFLQSNPVDYAAYLEHGDWAIHSLSPEQFLSFNGNVLSTEPIKGTRPRGKTQEEDDALLEELIHSEKEQAELFMIVDLLRNDLGKVCETGTVKVVKQKAVRKLSKVFHTYSVIEGKLKNKLKPMEAILSMSPGGSISGCPKRKAMEIVQDLESGPRGVYTGTIGYILPDGSSIFNIAIRTVIQRNSNLTLGVGGGITIDSVERDEYEETMAKAASFQP